MLTIVCDGCTIVSLKTSFKKKQIFFLTKIMTSQVMVSEVSGNTNPSTFRARAFQFTIHKLENYENFVKIFKELKSCDFGISCKEICPKTGKEHIHLYVHFSSQYKLNKKILSFNNHIELCRGSPKQNIDYIEKDGNIIEEINEQFMRRITKIIEK